ncbi:fibronectin type III domain-containing protein [Winogradskyella ursingii]|uniref:fibronectin type III domain-containing protein n=1 Tax=Winogradskyella ursingii TaxID=2686079 RepID=UPI0015CE4A0B|nr:hypothetical protein [Winogradskyella ursingii]
MKLLSKTLIVLFFLSSIILTNCSSSDDNSLENSDPGNFSANVINITFDGATVDWTSANDIDGDTVTYAIFLENEEIITNLPGFTYTFSGLDPETNYAGYVEARDGRGGTSRAEFLFTTESSVIVMEIPLSVIEEETSNTCVGGGPGVTFILGAEVPKYEGTVSYQAVFSSVVVDGFTFPGKNVNWDNSSTEIANTLKILGSGDYFPIQAQAYINCNNSPNVPIVRSRYENAAAGRTATITITRS